MKSVCSTSPGDEYLLSIHLFIYQRWAEDELAIVDVQVINVHLLGVVLQYIYSILVSLKIGITASRIADTSEIEAANAIEVDGIGTHQFGIANLERTFDREAGIEIF